MGGRTWLLPGDWPACSALCCQLASRTCPSFRLRLSACPSSLLQGAQRGLAEELGIEVAAQQLTGPLAATHRRELHQGGFHDVELVQSYR